RLEPRDELVTEPLRPDARFRRVRAHDAHRENGKDLHRPATHRALHIEGGRREDRREHEDASELNQTEPLSLLPPPPPADSATGTCPLARTLVAPVAVPLAGCRASGEIPEVAARSSISAARAFALRTRSRSSFSSSRRTTRSNGAGRSLRRLLGAAGSSLSAA